jgi:hypothetical protein
MPIPDSHELARLCTLDLGREVTSEHVRAYLLVGDVALKVCGFTDAECSDIFATIAKELHV